MYAAMASCSSSLALSRCAHPASLRSAPRCGRLSLRHRQPSVGAVFRGLKWKPCSLVASASGSEGAREIIDVEISNPTRKRGRPRKVEGSEEKDEEEEWDFFGELASHIESGSQRGWKEEDEEVVGAAARGKANGNATIPEAARPSSFEGRHDTEFLREEETSDEDDDVDFDDPKYQQKPDWMQDAVWEAIKNQGPGDDDDDEAQPFWVEEDDPNWPEEEPEDGWGFKTSQFFDKVSIKNDKPEAGDDDDDDDEELKMNWESEEDDWTINEITSSDWEFNVFSDPSPLVVYMFARYGRSGKDSWKMLEQLEKAVTSVWESGKAPLRAVKVDIGMEMDLGSALGVSKDECPQVLFVKNGKGLYRLKDQRNSEELMQLMAHFFYNGKRPSFLPAATSSSESLRSMP